MAEQTDDLVYANGHLDTVNRGDHLIHTGGKYESFLLAPVIPPR